MSALFFYGTLRHLPLLETVLDRSLSDLQIRDAVLPDHAVYDVRDEHFPMICSETGHNAPGLVVEGLGPEDLKRLKFYEAGFDFDMEPHTLNLTDGSRILASVFYPQPNLWTSAGPWSLQDWVDDWAEMSVSAAQEVMGYYGKVDADQISRSFPAIRTRAWARLAARKRHTGDPRDVRKDVVLQQHAREYVDYFGMERIELQHRLYDGSMGPVVHRSGLMQGSAVVVLPYDPIRDAVLLVEQFRAPVFMAEDPEPWMWEPVAGMIDPGETPKQAARRETLEEAHVNLLVLESAGSAYSSSGSSTEYLHLYVGLADLNQTVNNGGLASEGEDIRTQILPFVDFMDRVDAHGFKDLPLLALAHWLARHRNRLRS